jgi:endogenous inhibitor of DNA gyrase (YacG/DUF329 family)
MAKIGAFGGENPERALQQIVRQLNEGFKKEHGFVDGKVPPELAAEGEHPLSTEGHRNLIQLVQAWQQARVAPPPQGPTLNKMIFPPGCPDWHEMGKRCKTFLAPAGTGAYWTPPHYFWLKGKPQTAWDVACQIFLSLITNPERDRLGGPCPRCGKYFIRKTAKLSVYCSHRCASQDTAVKTTIKRRQEQHADKLALAEKARDRWKELLRKGRTKKDWKEWIAASNPEITVRFLTRAVNKGELVAPQQKGESE